MTGPEVVDTARAWIGTPYVHQQATKGAGCDCLGLLRGVWRELGTAPKVIVPAYTMDWSEASGDETLWRAARRFLVEKSGGEDPGDVLLFRMADGAVAKHVGIQAQTGATASFVHAYSGHGVVESSLSLPWRRRIAARFEFPRCDAEVL
ncbi:NlpC/P60 family protein [Roseobacteraceae bacterium S113]